MKLKLLASKQNQQILLPGSNFFHPYKMRHGKADKHNQGDQPRIDFHGFPQLSFQEQQYRGLESTSGTLDPESVFNQTRQLMPFQPRPDAQFIHLSC